MSTIQMQRSTAPATSSLPFSGFIAGIARVIQGRRAAAELTRLDDHILSDIGLTRDDVLGAFERPMVEDPTIHLASVVRERRASGWY